MYSQFTSLRSAERRVREDMSIFKPHCSLMHWRASSIAGGARYLLAEYLLNKGILVITFQGEFRSLVSNDHLK